MNEIKIHVCKCNQCKLKKRGMRGKSKRFFKRMTNKKRRQGKSFSLCYA